MNAMPAVETLEKLLQKLTRNQKGFPETSKSNPKRPETNGNLGSSHVS